MTNAVKQWTLEKEQEFRFEIDKTGTVKLVDGSAEIFGVEMARDVEYHFDARKLAVFTWFGCSLETTGSFKVEYVGRETSMQYHLNVHLALDQIRQSSMRAVSNGPRVLILGPSDSGKTTLAKTLANYSSKLAVAREQAAFAPIYVDLDTNEGSVSLPGTVSALVISRPIDVEEGFSAPITLTQTSPLVYYYGSLSPLEKPRLYDTLVTKLATVVKKKLEGAMAKAAGIIVDTPAEFVTPEGFKQISHVVEEFGITSILVIGQERLFSDLERNYKENLLITIIGISKSGGAVSRDKSCKRKMQLQRVKEYFYGSLKTKFTPFSQTVSFSDIVVRRVGEGSVAPSSALPIGHERKIVETKYVKVEPGDILLHSILAVSCAELPGVQQGGATKIYTPEEESQLLISSNISGFIYIAEVDEEKRKMTVLFPHPGKLPNTFLIMGGLKWMDA